jgi:hypothetical protein
VEKSISFLQEIDSCIADFSISQCFVSAFWFTYLCIPGIDFPLLLFRLLNIPASSKKQRLEEKDRDIQQSIRKLRQYPVYLARVDSQCLWPKECIFWSRLPDHLGAQKNPVPSMFSPSLSQLAAALSAANHVRRWQNHP